MRIIVIVSCVIQIAAGSGVSEDGPSGNPMYGGFGSGSGRRSNSCIPLTRKLRERISGSSRRCIERMKEFVCQTKGEDIPINHHSHDHVYPDDITGWSIVDYGLKKYVLNIAGGGCMACIPEEKPKTCLRRVSAWLKKGIKCAVGMVVGKKNVPDFTHHSVWIIIRKEGERRKIIEIDATFHGLLERNIREKDFEEPNKAKKIREIPLKIFSDYRSTWKGKGDGRGKDTVVKAIWKEPACPDKDVNLCQDFAYQVLKRLDFEAGREGTSKEPTAVQRWCIDTATNLKARLTPGSDLQLICGCLCGGCDCCEHEEEDSSSSSSD